MSIRSRHGSYTLSARSVRNPAAVNPKCANTDSAGRKIRAARPMGIVHASRNRVKVRWFFLLSIAEIILLADRRAIRRSPTVGVLIGAAMRDRSWIIGNPSLTRYGRVARYPPAIPEESVELNLQLGLKQCWEFRRTQHLCAGLSIGLTFHRVVRLMTGYPRERAPCHKI